MGRPRGDDSGWEITGIGSSPVLGNVPVLCGVKHELKELEFYGFIPEVPGHGSYCNEGVGSLLWEK